MLGKLESWLPIGADGCSRKGCADGCLRRRLLPEGMRWRLPIGADGCSRKGCADGCLLATYTSQGRNFQNFCVFRFFLKLCFFFYIKTNYEHILDDKSPITDSSQNKQYEINRTVQKKNIPRQNQKFVSENMSKQMKLAFCIGNLYIFSISKRMCLQ